MGGILIVSMAFHAERVLVVPLVCIPGMMVPRVLWLSNNFQIQHTDTHTHDSTTLKAPK